MEIQQQSVGDQQTEDEYSVWALPPPEVRCRIKNLMSGILSEIGGPEFDPHITLVWATRLTCESATRRFRSASETISPFALRIAAISGRHLIMEPTPKVLEVAAHCCSHFGFVTTRPYRPHSSLFYGELTKEETERVQERIEELDGGIVGLEFVVSSIGLSKTDTKDKSLKSWKIVEICNLEKILN